MDDDRTGTQKSLDTMLVCLESLRAANLQTSSERSRDLSMATTALEESIMWLRSAIAGGVWRQ